MPIKVLISKSDSKGKKMKAEFYERDKRIKTTHFGASGMSDYTIHKDPQRKERYLERHRKNENWQDYKTAGSLSRYILWNLPTLSASIADYKKRFNLI
jgi:hypothetical protein